VLTRPLPARPEQIAFCDRTDLSVSGFKMAKAKLLSLAKGDTELFTSRKRDCARFEFEPYKGKPKNPSPSRTLNNSIIRLKGRASASVAREGCLRTRLFRDAPLSRTRRRACSRYANYCAENLLVAIQPPFESFSASCCCGTFLPSRIFLLERRSVWQKMLRGPGATIVGHHTPLR